MAQRVKWVCGAGGCSKGEHYGEVNVISWKDAVAEGLTADTQPQQRPYVGVHFEDRPGVLEYHPWSELEPVGSQPNA